jgi:tripartite-type tricarboxylate transporter receptor subunit TctC
MIDPGYTRDSFVPLAPVARTSFVLAVHKRAKIDSYEDFCRHVRDSSTEWALGFWHQPTSRVISKWIGQAGLPSPRLVNYTGSSTQAHGLESGEINFVFDTWVAASSNPNVKVLAVLDQQGHKEIAQPTLTCLSDLYSGIDIDNWYGVVAPATMNPNLTQQLSEIIAQGLAQEKYQQRLADLSFRPWSGTSKDFDDQQTKTIDFYSKL